MRRFRARRRVARSSTAFTSVAVLVERVSPVDCTRPAPQTAVDVWSVVTSAPNPVPTSVRRALDGVRTGEDEK